MHVRSARHRSGPMPGHPLPHHHPPTLSPPPRPRSALLPCPSPSLAIPYAAPPPRAPLRARRHPVHLACCCTHKQADPLGFRRARAPATPACTWNHPDTSTVGKGPGACAGHRGAAQPVAMKTATSPVCTPPTCGDEDGDVPSQGRYYRPQSTQIGQGRPQTRSKPANQLQYALGRFSAAETAHPATTDNGHLRGGRSESRRCRQRGGSACGEGKRKGT